MKFGLFFIYIPFSWCCAAAVSSAQTRRRFIIPLMAYQCVIIKCCFFMNEKVFQWSTNAHWPKLVQKCEIVRDVTITLRGGEIVFYKQNRVPNKNINLEESTWIIRWVVNKSSNIPSPKTLLYIAVTSLVEQIVFFSSSQLLAVFDDF